MALVAGSPLWPASICSPTAPAPSPSTAVSIDEYFGLDTLKMVVRQPLEATGNTGKMDVVATVTGGGVSGQAGALRHGMARALLLASEDNRPILKKAGFLTRDPR